MTDTQNNLSGQINRQKRRRIFAIAAALALVAGISAMAIAQLAAPPPLEAIMPADSQCYVMLNAGWALQATGSIRNMPEVTKALKDVEANTGVSVDNDILPWVGKVGITTENAGTSAMRIIAAFQVKDAEAFSRTVDKIKSKVPKLGGMPITPSEYKGTPIFRIETKNMGPSGMPVAFSLVNGWAIAGIGKGAIEKALDTDMGRSPSLLKNPAYAAGLQKVSPDSILILSANPATFMNLFSKFSPGFKNLNMSYVKENSNCQITFAVRDDGNGFRFDSTGVPQNETTRKMYMAYAANMHPVSAAVLKRVPDAVMATIFSNPNYIWKHMKTTILAEQMDKNTNTQFKHMFNAMAPFEKTFAHYTKECGFALTWRRDRGFGLVIIAQADSHEAAVNTGIVVAKELKKIGAPIMRGGSSWALTVPLQAAMPPDIPIKLSPCMTAKDDWFVISTNPSWTAVASSSPKLQIPAEAAGAYQVQLATMEWLPALLDYIEKQPGAANDIEAKQVLSIIRGMELDKSKSAGWAIISPDGAVMFGTGIVSNWNWREAIENTANAIKNWQPSQHKWVKPMKHAPDAG